MEVIVESVWNAQEIVICILIGKINDKLLEVEPSAFLANLCSRNVLNTVRD